jgi:hypothetical protein
LAYFGGVSSCVHAESARLPAMSSPAAARDPLRFTFSSSKTTG